ncbi:MAG: type II secretion system major pseudopilin GspG [Candidatus Poribacteria bacterium]|nr:type II secretion system major pseudopilin GspG [Candidatus Poribacteria bacterium]
MFTQLKSDESGLTLIELTIVIVILGILAAFIAPRVMNWPQKANVSKAQTEISGLKTALEMYAISVGDYPTTEQGLTALWRAPSPAPPNWDGPYIDSPTFEDPWGNSYVYRQPVARTGYAYELYSMGKDGKVGGTELDADITNWVEETTAAY